MHRIARSRHRHHCLCRRQGQCRPCVQLMPGTIGNVKTSARHTRPVRASASADRPRESTHDRGIRRTHRFGSVLLVPCRDRLRCVHREICIDECTGTVNGATLHRSCASASAPALPYPTNPAQTQAVPTAPLHFLSLIPLADIFAHESKRNHREFFLRVPWVTAILVVPIDKVVKGGAVDTGADLC